MLRFYDMGIIKNKDIELMSKSQDELFMDGFQLPNIYQFIIRPHFEVRKQDKTIQNTNEDKLIPSIDDLDFPQDSSSKNVKSLIRFIIMVVMIIRPVRDGYN